MSHDMNHDTRNEMKSGISYVSGGGFSLLGIGVAAALLIVWCPKLNLD